MSHNSSYLYNIYQPDAYQKTVKEALKEVKGFLKRSPFDAIAFRGSSGAALAYPLGAKLKVGLIHIRKDLGHHYTNYEGVGGISSYIIVDDFIASGGTIEKICEEVNEFHFHWGCRPELKAIFLYSRHVKGDITDDFYHLLKRINYPNCKIYSIGIRY